MKHLSPSELLDSLAVEPDSFVDDLVRGVDSGIDSLDSLIAGASVGWEIDRMPALDRSVLRLAAFELCERVEVPVAVVIDEAVELVKEYSTEESGRFVNGVLSTLAAQVRTTPEDGAGSQAP